VTEKNESSTTENTEEELVDQQKEDSKESIDETVDTEGDTAQEEPSSDENTHDSDIEALEDKVSLLEESEKEAQDKLLRTLAEFENFKKRQEVEKLNFVKYANEKTILDLLPVMDSFSMAKPQFDASDEKDLKEGFVLIFKQLETFFEKMGVEKIDAIDQEFDPNLHQAISSEEVEGVDANKVVKVMQDGFKMADKVIRPAMVVVSK
tara:strand:+ start:50 stop:670 length:621 start_codon:yes stop_codon:yes gene_type:complete